MSSGTDAVIETGFGQAVAAAFPVLYRFAVALSSRDEADDLVQDALTRAWVKRDQYNATRGSMQSWLLAIVADQARGRWRRRRGVINVNLGGETMVAGPEDATADLDLLRAIAHLPPRQRSALVLRLYVDLPLDDVAALMRCSTGTVKATLHAARTAVGRSLGADYGKG